MANSKQPNVVLVEVAYVTCILINFIFTYENGVLFVGYQEGHQAHENWNCIKNPVIVSGLGIVQSTLGATLPAYFKS